MKVADEKNLTLGNADLDAYVKVAASTTPGNEDIRIVNTNGTDEAAIAITATSGGVDIDAAAGRDVHISGGQVTLVSKTNEANAISLTADQGSSETVTVTNTQGTDNSAIELTAAAGGITMKVADEKELTLGNAALDAYVKVAPSGTVGNEDIRIVNTNGSDDAAIEINATSGGLAMTAKNSTFNMTTLGSAVLTTNSAASDKITLTNVKGNSDDSIQIKSTVGGLNMTAKTSTFDMKTDGDISLVANTATGDNISITNTQGTAADAVKLLATAGGIDVDAAANKDINISGGSLTMVSKQDTPSAISFTTNIGTSETIVLTNTQGTTNDAISLAASAGGITMKVADEKDLTLGNTALDAYIKVAAASNDANEDIRIVNTNGTDEAAIALTASAGGVDIDAAAGKDVNISGGQIAVVSKTNEADAISLSTNVGAAETISVTNTKGTSNTAINLSSVAGGITMKVADGKDLTLGNADLDAYVVVAASGIAGNEDIRLVNTNGTDESAIALTATAGGVDIDAAAGKDVHISGGQLTLASKTDEASAISLTTNVGTSETIVVTNTQGTDESAIALTATAGGVDIDAADGKDVHISGGQLTLESKTDEASAISLTTNVGTSETIVVTNTQGTDNAAIAMTSTAGGITMKVANEKDLTLGNAGLDAYVKVAASATAGSEDIRIVNTNGTDESAIALTATAGGVDIDAAAGKDVNISGGQIALVSKTNEADAISLTTNVGVTETITLTNTKGTDNAAIALTSTVGGVSITGKNSTFSMETAGDIALTANTATTDNIAITNTQGTAAKAIELEASACSLIASKEFSLAVITALPPSAHRSLASFQDNPIPPAVELIFTAPPATPAPVCDPSVVPAVLTISTV